MEKVSQNYDPVALTRILQSLERRVEALQQPKLRRIKSVAAEAAQNLAVNEVGYVLSDIEQDFDLVVRAEDSRLYRITGMASTSGGGSGSGGTTDHGSLSGLGDDDHTQYHNDTRGDVRYPLKSLLTTKGDLFVRDASVVNRLGVGTDGYILTADSTQALGVKWAASAPVGSSYVVISLDGTLTNERNLAITGGLTLTDGGANAAVTLGLPSPFTSGNVLSANGSAFVSLTPDAAGLVDKSSTQTGIAGNKTWTGYHIFQPSVNSATAFQVKNAAGAVKLVVDTANTSLGNVIAIHQTDQVPYLAGYFNDTYSLTTPVFQYYATDTGDFGFGTPAAKKFFFYVNGINSAKINLAGNGNVGFGVGRDANPACRMTFCSAPAGNASGAEVANAPTSISKANVCLNLGNGEYGTNSYRLIGFGYIFSAGTHVPAYIGYQEISSASRTYGDLIFGTRAVTSDTQPSERLRIRNDGFIGIGNAAPDTFVHLTLNNATTAAVDNILTIEHASTGTPAAGFGGGLIFTLESSTTAKQSAGRLTYEWVVATHASRTARSKWSVYDTAEREAIRIEASGSAPMIGVYGVAAVARPSAYTQTYSTADKTHAGRTASTLTDNSAGTANTTVEAIPDPADTPASADALRDDIVANLLPALRNNFADLAAQINALKADSDDTAQVVNSILDDLQLEGWLQ